MITSDARKRLDAVNSMEDLGAGFALASHDLEIRGAGELLGETQSGSIDDVGFSLYSEYLAMAVNSIKQGKLPDFEVDQAYHDRMTAVDLHVPALFPDTYLSNAHTRLVMYKRIASSTSLEELEELQVETIDRFGLLPDQGKNLFRLTAIRIQAEKLDIRKLDVSGKGGTIEFHDNPVVDVSIIFQLINDNPLIYRLAGPNAVRILPELDDVEERINQVDVFLDTLENSLQ